MTLTAKTIWSLPPPASGRAEIRDGLVRGLWLRISSMGSRSFVVRFRRGGRHGQPRRVTLGPTPPLTLAGARKRAKELLAHVRLHGEEPARPGDAPKAPEFRELVAAYVTARTRLAEKTAYEYRRAAKAHLADRSVGGLSAREVTRGDIRALLSRVAKASGPTEANRLFELIRATCRWACREDRLEADPSAGVERPGAPGERDRVLSDAEVSALWAATAPAACHVQAGACIRIQLLLGQRPTETLLMRWADVDLGASRWTIPGAFRKGRRANVVPLPPLARRLLKALPMVGERVFPGLSFHMPAKWWDPIRTRVGDILAKRRRDPPLAAGEKRGLPDFTRHDLRRTCATGCAAAGAEPHIVSRILGHKQLAGTLAVTGIYDRFDRLPQVLAALTAWASRVEKVARKKG